MDIRNPEYILEIARQASVTRAAEKLFVTQSTLSQYLLKLEAEVGTSLFLREKSGLVPTDAGQIYLQAARDIVRIQHSAEERIAALNNEGSIRLGCSTWGLNLAAECLQEFKEKFPAVSLKLYELAYAPIKNMLQAGKLDMAIIAVIPEDDLPAQGFQRMGSEELVLILPADLAFCKSHPQQESIRQETLAEDLQDVSFILGAENSTTRRTEDALFSRRMFRPNVACEMTSRDRHDLVQKLVADGAGAAIVPQGDLAGLPNVRTFRLDPPLRREEILVFHRDVEKTAAMQYLEEVLLAHARKES